MCRQKGALLLAILWVSFLTAGCSVQKLDTKKLHDLDYEVLEEADIPEEMKSPIVQWKKKEFIYTYADKGSLYIARGYGGQETDGYKVEVLQLYESEHAIVLKTQLLGPEADTEVSERTSYPYVVIRTKYSDKYVMME